MKFSDGYWMTREGFDVRHPAQAYEVDADARTVSVLAPTRVIRTRADTLNSPTATITLSSPAADVIRVRVEHHAGRGVRDRISPSPAPVSRRCSSRSTVIERHSPRAA